MNSSLDLFLKAKRAPSLGEVGMSFNRGKLVQSSRRPGELVQIQSAFIIV